MMSNVELGAYKPFEQLDSKGEGGSVDGNPEVSPPPRDSKNPRMLCPCPGGQTEQGSLVRGTRRMLQSPQQSHGHQQPDRG